MKSFRPTHRAMALLEYVVLIMIILGAFYVMRPYIQRAFNGSWKKSGDSFGFGRQYENSKVAECAFGLIDSGRGVWYDSTCYRQLVSLCPAGDIGCENKSKNDCAQGYCCEEKASTAGISTNCP